MQEYKVLKEISLLTLAQAGPKGCREFSVEYIKLTLKMRHHDSEFGTWVIIPNHDHESRTHFKSFIKWAEEDPKRIDWLIKQGFVEKVEPELIPLLCPFCGHRGMNKPVIQSETYKFYHVSCSHCHARGPVSHTKHEAIKAWNRRA